jgi:kinase, pfkB family
VKQKTGERAVFFERSTASDPEFLDNYQGLIENASIVHINGRHRHLMRTAIDIARQSGTIISLDGGAQRYDDDMRPITESSHVVIVARDYAEKYTGATNLEEACCIIHDRGALIAGVTDGANGSYFVWPDGTAYRCQPFPQASVVDTTGAGDSFHGAFLSKLAVSIRQENTLYGEFIKPIDILQSLDHKQLESAAIFASAVSALNTQGIGGRSALPSLKSACNLAGLE